MTKSELENLFADGESRLKLLNEFKESVKTDIDKVETKLTEGRLTLNEFLHEFQHKQSTLDRTVSDLKPLYRALYLISKKIEELK